MKIDEALAQIQKMEGELEGPPAVVMNHANFEAYIEREIAKSVEEITGGKVDEAKKRMDAVKAAIATAKASFESSGTATIKPYKDPWQLLPTTKEANPAALPQVQSGIEIPGDLATVEKAAGGFGVVLKPTEKLKALCAIAKASAKSPLHAKLAKSDDGKSLIAKAGEATAILQKIAGMFGIAYSDSEDLLDWELRCDVGDMISALQSAAKLEVVMSTLGGTMALKSDPAATPPAPTPPAAPAVTPPVPPTPPATGTPAETAKADAFDSMTDVEPDAMNDGQWPMDLSSDRTPVAKDAFTVKKAAPPPQA